MSLMGVYPTFSIIMTSFNYAPYIGDAIKSILTQTFQDWELLIVDDCSTDESWRVIQEFKDPRIRAHRQPVNLGANSAYNWALSIAQGEYIACLDSDDLFMPNKLERQAVFFERHPEIDICGSLVIEIDAQGEIASGASPYAEWFNTSVDLNDPSKWLWENRLCHSGAVVRKDLHDRLGEFENGLVYTADWQFWLRALVAGARFDVVQEPLVAYRNHGNNITHKNTHGTLLEHANTCAGVLVPWLKQQGRLDLIEIVIEGFFSNSLLVSDADLQTGCAEALFSGNEDALIGSMAMHLAIRQQGYLAEVLKGKEWLELKLSEQTAQLSEQTAQLSEQTAQLNEQAAQLSTQTAELGKQAAQFQRLKSALPVRVLLKIGLVSYE